MRTAEEKYTEYRNLGRSHSQIRTLANVRGDTELKDFVDRKDREASSPVWC